MNKQKGVFALVAVVTLTGVLWLSLPAGTDPQVAKVIELQGKLFNEDSAIPQVQRREAFEELRKEADKLSPEQFGQLMRDNPPPFVRQMQQNVQAYFKLPEDQRKAHLDKQIDEMENRRKAMQASHAAGGKQRGMEGGPGPGGPGFGPPGRFGANMDPAKQSEMRTKMLDNTSPQERAMVSQYIQQLEQRLRERGFPVMGGPPF